MGDSTVNTADGGPVTGYHVARAAGVSQSTVSRALRGDARVVPETRELVLRVAREMGYVVNASARSLITRRTSSVAIVSGDLRNPSYPVIISTLQRSFHAHGYRVVLMSDHEEQSGEFEQNLDGLRGGIVDGIVYVSARTSSPVVADLLDARMPVVVLNRDVDTALGGRVDRMTSDNAEGGRLVARHLHAIGARRPAMVAGPRDNPSLARRERGFRAELSALGLTLPRERVRRGQVDPRTGLEGALSLLGDVPAGQRPDAVFCQTDYIALGVLDAAGRLGLSVPGDVAVIGYNDLDWAGWSMIDLTTVRQPLVEMAEAAAAAMLERIADPDRPRVHRVFGVELVERGSTRRRGA
ncbi:LacI family DNA-binding transcriptional regulator [Kineococcus sp. SYSU DK002]|uniref:LacI family DNA-binding transcriptional regulator n=1 Tax=Kineococcus sp. SYSU DK002 TaxID=3383123 RepID=UPI003D7DB4F5